MKPISWVRRLWSRGGPEVPVIRLSGAIGAAGIGSRGLTLETLAKPIEQAFAMKSAPCVVLEVNSPGGSPVQSALIAGRIRELAEEKQKPVLAFVEDIAASGGYWLATAADEIFADNASLIGSIGVITAGFGFPRALDRLGIERRVHTAGAHKAKLDPFRPEDPEDIVWLKGIQADIHRLFIEHVSARRGDKLVSDSEPLFDGGIWTGGRAIDLGLIDGIGHLRPVLRSRYGDKVKLRPITGRKGLMSRIKFGDAIAREAAGGLMAAAEERALWQRYGL